MLIRETLYKSPTKRIALYVDKHRNNLVLNLQEWDACGDGMESMAMFSSWGPRVASQPCPRATKLAVQRFYMAHIAEAKALVAARVAVLEAPAVPA